MTALFPLKMKVSIIKYTIAGTVVKAIQSAYCLCERPRCGVNLRPKKRANVVNVPYSLSNLSNRGVKATTLRNAWMTFRCINGNVLIRYASRGHY